jgi:molecular chaperone DnaJ
MVFTRTCAACGGGGLLRFRTCEACAGEGVGVHTGPLAVDVPPGTVDGASIVVPGEGHAGRRGGARGALRLVAAVQPHPWFTRVGDDLGVDLPVAIHEAAFGAVIDVPTWSGRARLRVPAGATSGQTFRLRGRGMPGRRGRGDLVVRIQIALPPALDERSLVLLREFAERNPGNPRDGWATAGAAPHEAVARGPVSEP